MEPGRPQPDGDRAERAPRTSSPVECLAGGGEAGAIMRSIDWGRTPLGPPETWSPALCSTVALLLHNQGQMLLWWGPEFVQLYNDAYTPVLGDKHPRAMGQPARECWREIWHILQPMVERPYRGGPASTSDDLLLFINRKGFFEETHFNVAYSPVPDATVEPTRIGGVLATVTETTEQVYGERQLRTLRALGARAVDARTTAENACETAAAILAENGADVPFALFYLLDETGGRAHLVARTGFDGNGAAPAADIDLGAGGSPWPLAPVVAERAVRIVTDLPPELPAGPRGESARTAIALPLASPDQALAYGVLVCGVSPHRALDTGYQTFFELVAGQVVTAIRNARALEAERKRAEELAALDRAKTTFFSNISHEFRTPLTLMLGPTEDALSSGRALAGDELRAVHRNELRLLKLVNSLLDFSRMEAGRAQARFEPTDLSRLTQDLASAFRSAVERAGLGYRIDCAPLDEPIYVDRGMWEKIVLNLLSNALKFTFDGSISVELHGTGDGVELVMRDTGTGISAEELPRMFERFHRIEGARGRTYEGSGIGLALVSEMVAMHGGNVLVESELGAGSTFRVRLRRGRAHLPPDRVAAGSPQGHAGADLEAYVGEALRWLPAAGTVAPSAARDLAPPAADVTQGARILLVDDNADMREYVGRLLAQRWRVETVTNGAAALEAARRERPDLVLSDVMMPVMDGFTLLREMRADPALASVPIILLSARAGEESRVEGLQAGADDYLVKPFSARELLARVTTHLQVSLLRASSDADRRRLFEIFAQAPVAIAVFRGPEHRIELANAHYCAMVGRRADAIVGQPLLQVFPELAGTEAFAIHDRILTTGEPFATPEYGVSLDVGRGLEQRWFNATSVPLRDARGVVDSIVLVGVDVTEQVRARQRLGALTEKLEEAVGTLTAVFDNAPVGMALFDRDLRYLQVNRALAEMNGLSIAAHLGRRLSEVLPHLPPEVEGQLRVVLATGRPLVDLEVRGRTPASADERVWETSWFPVKRGEGAVICVGVIVVDVTDRRRAEEVRERASRFAEQFMGILGHDLRNPLSSIAMGSALLKRKLEGTAETRTVDRITSSANRMSRMVSQLLDLTRGRLIGGIPIERSPANLSEVVLAAVDELRTAFPARVVHCRVPPAVLGGWDIDRLAQVVSNLVGNAIQHGDPAEPVEVDLTADDARVTLRVQNRGAAIPPDLLPVLFEPFRRGPQDAGGKMPAGLGLGLYISEQVVRAHGGAIRVESDADTTVFSVTMPILPGGTAADRDLR